MAATLNIRCSFEAEINGRTITGNHGLTTDGPTDDFAITVDGQSCYKPDQLATASVRTLWDEDSERPADFDYMFFWADQDIYLQIIGSSTNVTLKVKAKVPIILGHDEILAAANTTALSAGVTPTMENIDSILISNVSGSTANYLFFAID